MSLHRFMSFVMLGVDGCLLQRPVHSLDSAISPRMIRFGEPMLDAMLLANEIEHMGPPSSPRPHSIKVLNTISESADWCRKIARQPGNTGLTNTPVATTLDRLRRIADHGIH